MVDRILTEKSNQDHETTIFVDAVLAKAVECIHEIICHCTGATIPIHETQEIYRSELRRAILLIVANDKGVQSSATALGQR